MRTTIRWEENYAGESWSGWKIEPQGTVLPDVSAFLASLSTPCNVLRDDERSRVLLFDHFPGLDPESASGPVGKWVAKSPCWKDRRLWNQLTTLYRHGESRQVFLRSRDLSATGFPLPEVLYLLERRRAGMVVESWMVYRFVEGERVGPEAGEEVIALLALLHEAGWRHRDPHLANWLRGEEGLVALDVNPRKRRFWAADASYDFVLLRNCAPELQALIPGVGSLAWKIAELRNWRVQSWRKVKRFLRGK